MRVIRLSELQNTLEQYKEKAKDIDNKMILEHMQDGTGYYGICKEVGLGVVSGKRQIHKSLLVDFDSEQLKNIMETYERIHFWDFLTFDSGLWITHFQDMCEEYIYSLPYKYAMNFFNEPSAIFNDYLDDPVTMANFFSSACRQNSLRRIQTELHMHFDFRKKPAEWIKRGNVCYKKGQYRDILTGEELHFINDIDQTLTTR